MMRKIMSKIETEHPGATPSKRNLSSAARRALVEAEQRRKAAKPAKRAKEIGGREGPEPARYGDWEKNGIASDF